MLTDIATIIWKESREFITVRPGLRGGWTGILIILAVFGILIPLQSGREWLIAPTTILMWAWLPFILVNSVVADSFAGERGLCMFPVRSHRRCKPDSGEKHPWQGKTISIP